MILLFLYCLPDRRTAKVLVLVIVLVIVIVLTASISLTCNKVG